VAAIPAKADSSAARKAEIRLQIAKVCPTPMTSADLDRAATVVERYAADRDVTATVGRALKMDRETGVCRGA
jgi:hypothetical protein